ncbi:hypothetical protein K7432_011431 [Basidiobolus ranarum]|uniref:Uncharacterized protein n=1 Tax=Basidiobolus ranarum TaxID=34480 RepID=A0ABR2VTW2_9FUNG
MGYMCVVDTKRNGSTVYEKNEAKKQKTNAKRYTEPEESSPVCLSCHQEGHKSSRSKDCPNHKMTKQEQPEKGLVKKIVHAYCYQYVCGGIHVWPDDLPEAYNDKMPAIEEICRELSAIDMPKPVTLSASPGVYIPMLASIMRKYEVGNTHPKPCKWSYPQSSYFTQQ